MARSSSSQQSLLRMTGSLGRALEAGGDGGGQRLARRSLRPRSTASPSDDARLQVEREGHRGKLARVVDRERARPSDVSWATAPSGTSSPSASRRYSRLERRQVALVLRAAAP